MNKNDMLEQLKNARSWKELGYTLQEVYNVLSSNQEGNDKDKNAEIKMLKEKVERLSDANKQLRAENKELKGKK